LRPEAKITKVIADLMYRSGAYRVCPGSWRLAGRLPPALGMPGDGARLPESFGLLTASYPISAIADFRQQSWIYAAALP
jgi:hypothetical protein